MAAWPRKLLAHCLCGSVPPGAVVMVMSVLVALSMVSAIAGGSSEHVRGVDPSRLALPLTHKDDGGSAVGDEPRSFPPIACVGFGFKSRLGGVEMLMHEPRWSSISMWGLCACVGLPGDVGTCGWREVCAGAMV